MKTLNEFYKVTKKNIDEVWKFMVNISEMLEYNSVVEGFFSEDSDSEYFFNCVGVNNIIYSELDNNKFILVSDNIDTYSFKYIELKNRHGEDLPNEIFIDVLSMEKIATVKKECLVCYGELNWVGDFTNEDYGYEDIGIVSMYKCGVCGCEIECYSRA